MEKKKSRAVTVLFGVFTCLIVMYVLYYAVGGGSFSVDTPIVYVGGDETSYAAEVKMMLDSNSWKATDYLGAPFGTDRTANISCYLFNDVHLLSFLFVKLTGSVGMAVNLTFFTVVLLTALVSYAVMRSRQIDPFVAMCGAAVYSTLPYLFLRNISHMMLAALECIPLAVLLCIWIYEDDRFWKFGKGFWRYRRNLAGILFGFLIANNGIGYYAVFSCMMFVVAGVSRSFKTRSWRGIVQAVCQTGTVVVSLCVLLSGYFVSILNGGEFHANARSMPDTEAYSLRIMHLLTPTWGSGIGRLDNKLNEYAQVAVYPAEQTEFLGYVGVIGFVLLILVLFCRFRESSRLKTLGVLAELNICCILFGTLGGFSVILYLFVTDMVRCTNRLSVYIAFFSIFTVCLVVSEGMVWLRTRLEKREEWLWRIVQLSVYFVFGLFCAVSIKAQARLVFDTAGAAAAYEEDRVFVSRIESSVSENAMIYQLPYHVYPEGGPRQNMPSDKLFMPYLHSETLRWSYGALSTERAAKWNEYVSRLNAGDMVDALAYMGFEGIYIDASAYTDEELADLLDGLGEYLGEPMVSETRGLYFYNLKEYTDERKSGMTEEEWNAQVDAVQNFG